jgi:hypothetical protein
MANYFKYFLFSLFTFHFSILVSSCQEGREAGDLFGQWQMAGNNDLYLAFSGSVTVCRNSAGANVYGNFQHTGDSLFIQCYSEKAEKADTIMVEESFGFKPFNNIRLKIEQLDNDHITLSKNGKTWIFNKW